MMTQERTWLNGWGNYPRISAVEHNPSHFQQAFQVQKESYLPRGLGRSYGDASLPAERSVALNTQNLDRFLNFDATTGILEAESGVSLQHILKYFVPKGFFLPVTPGTKFVTLGGAVASNVHGKNHHHDGSIEHFITELKVRIPSGELVTCSPKKHSDLFRGTIAGYGLTGLIETVTLQMRPIETAYMRTKQVPSQNLEHTFQLFQQYDDAYPYSVAWLDTLATGKKMGRSVLILGDHAKLHELSPKQQKAPYQVGEPGKINIPFYCPQMLLNKYFLSWFNASFYHLKRTTSHEGEKLQSYEPFFYPLDLFYNWNRMYGKRGFFQYQLVIPDPHGEEGIRDCLTYLSDQGIGSFLSVLKRCGDDFGIVPFAKQGYTLALDIPFRENTLSILDELDERVLRYNGRVYLTKDARLSPTTFRQMYPEYKEWQNIINKYNPNRIVWSKMAERLELSPTKSSVGLESDSP